MIESRYGEKGMVLVPGEDRNGGSVVSTQGAMPFKLHAIFFFENMLKYLEPLLQKNRSKILHKTLGNSMDP